MERLRLCLFIMYSKCIGIVYRFISYFILVKEDRAIFISFSGKNYDSNPRYFYEYIKNKDLVKEYVWAFKELPNNNVSGTIQVKYGSLQYFYQLMKSKYWFYDVGISRGVDIGNRGHVVVHFCHGNPYKKMGKDMNNLSYINLYCDYQIGKISTYFLSQSTFATKIYSNAYNAKKNSFLEIGYPRTDCLFNLDEYKIADSRLTKYLGLNIILYLPTMREWRANDSGYLDFLTDISLPNDYIFMVKSHPSHKVKIDNPKIIDVSNVTTINDLYYLSNFMITDYSTAIYDYSITGKPIILYQHDYDEYIKKRGVYISREKMPLLSIRDKKMLVETINKLITNENYYNTLAKKTKVLKDLYVEKDSSLTNELLYKELINEYK